MNEQMSPEEAELEQAFNEMTTVVMLANTTLTAGDLAAARQIYDAALTLFENLGNNRGMSIVRNNLGNVHTLLARELVEDAYKQSPTITGGSILVPSRRESRLSKAEKLFEAAQLLYKKAIDDAQARYNGAQQQNSRSYPRPPPREGIANSTSSSEASSSSRSAGRAAVAGYSSYSNGGGQDSNTMELGTMMPPIDAAAGEARMNGGGDGGGSRGGGTIGGREEASVEDLMLQLVNRKFNLAICLADKGGTGRDDKATDQARELFKECKTNLDRTDSFGVERRVRTLLQCNLTCPE